MKQLLLLLLAMPLLVYSQADKNILTVSRYFPKADKVNQFEKALGAHAQKYHTGDTKWAVFTVETGPDASGYNVLEGPSTWDAVDKRGDISKAHMDDWNLSIQPLLTERTSTMYLTYRQDLSTVMVTDFSDKSAVNHYFYKPGYYAEMENMMKDLKKTWEASDQYVAVYEASTSGEPQFIAVTRYKTGLQERTAGRMAALPVRFAKANGGESAWTRYIETFRQAVDHQYGEMLFYKPALSSKQ